MTKLTAPFLSFLITSLRVTSLFILSMPAASVPAAGVELNMDKVLEVSVSRKGLTRISVEGDQIVDLFAYPANVQNSLQLHKSGHVYVIGEDLKEPLYVSLITRKGKTQDVKLIDQDLTASPVILKESATTAVFNQTDDVSAILGSFVQGTLAVGTPPSDFLPSPLQEHERSRDELCIQGEGAWQGRGYLIVQFEITNTGDETIRLRGEQVAFPHDLAIAFDKSILAPGEKSHFFAIQKKRSHQNTRKEIQHDEQTL
jgi:hypothetical protein